MTTNLERRNSAAMRSAQLAYDNAEPPCDDDRDEYIEGQVDDLLSGHDADHIPFFSRGMDRGFAERADEIIHAIDDHEFPLLQMVLAVNNENHELAKKLAQRFMPALVKLAENLVETKINETPVD